jgi:hypothetical protein
MITRYGRTWTSGRGLLYVISINLSNSIEYVQQEIQEYQSAMLNEKVEESTTERITRFNDVLFTKLSHLQYDMLTFNLPKD